MREAAEEAVANDAPEADVTGVQRMNRSAAKWFLLGISLGISCAVARARPLPAVVAGCDPSRLNAAMLGRARLLAAAGVQSEAILCFTGGALVSPGLPAANRVAQAVALADAAGVDVVNLAARDLDGEPAVLAAAILAAKARFVSASFRLAPGETSPWANVVFVERGGREYAVIGLADQPLVPRPNAISGLVYIEPKEALTAALSRVGNAAGVIVLADLPLEKLRALLDEPSRIDLIVVSGRGGGAPSVPGQIPVVRAAPGGAAVTVILTGGAGARPTADSVVLREPAVPCAAFRALETTGQLKVQPVPDLPSLTGDEPAG